jgi:hypothetical protein
MDKPHTSVGLASLDPPYSVANQHPFWNPIMAEYKNREHYIPLRQSDLLELLCRDLGADRTSVESFKELNKLLSATFHFEYYQLLQQMKDEYAPFNPDAVTKPIHDFSAADKTREIDKLNERFVFLMERANFHRLTLDEVKEITKGSSDWGLDMDVDFNIFEKIEVFSRGDTTGTRYLRRWYRFWEREEVRLPIYKRLVLFVKMKPSKRLPPEVDTNTVFLKIFKDIPKLDMEMLLPGATLRMPGFHRLKLGGSLVSGAAYIVYSMFSQLGQILQGFSAALLMGPLAAVFGYGYKQWYGYQTTRTAFSLRLTQSLYYQTLGTNESVLFHLLDEAEEQECREALLGYYYLWRYAGTNGWAAKDLDDYVEMDLERLANLKVDFEIDDALAKLERLKLVTKNGDRYVATPIAKALESLDYAWDNFFKHNKR